MSKRTLLLADDSVTIQKVVNLTFADEGIDVVTVGDGDSAMEKISQIAPDVLLLDVHMPGLSGYQICEIVRQNPVTKNLPVILLVGSFEPFDEGEAARVGANAYLTKPFQSIRQLVSQVTELIDVSRPQEEAVAAEDLGVSNDVSEEERHAEEGAANPPATEDIDSLYHRSFSEPAQPESEVDSGTPRYVDAGMDDEMIETSSFPAVERDDLSASDHPKEDGESEYEEQTPEYSPDHVADDRQEAPQNYERDYSSPDSMPADHEAPTSEFQYRESSEASTSGFQYQQSNEAPAYGEESAEPVTDAGRIGAAVAGATADAFSEFDEFSRTEQIPAFETPAPARDPRFDDEDLLDLPPIENGKTLEFAAKTPDSSEVENKQVVNLSPELMEIIVQKVVEKLSDKN